MAAITVLLGAVFAILSAHLAMAENKAELQVIQGNTQLTANLFRILGEDEGENVFFSPLSVHTLLSMAYQGAQGTTAEAFASTLNLPDASTAAEGYNVIMDHLNNVPNITLLMANKMFLGEGNEVVEAFNTAITKQFHSEVQLVNFAKNAAAAKTINDWVKEKTREKIQDLIGKDDLDGLTRLVLVNAIYFKGNWKNKFDASNTTTELFYLNNADTVDVKMMHIQNNFNYRIDNELNAEILQLPYSNEDLSMFIILPKKRDGIQDLEKKLQNYDFAKFTELIADVGLDLALPRFKIEQTIDLQDPLTKLGLGEIFDQGKANFKGMISLKPNENLCVTKAVQKAFIEVNEEGAEAAAATGLAFGTRTARQYHPVKVDHPFIIQIVYSKPGSSRIILFQGRVNKP